MPLIIDEVQTINTHQKSSARLFKRKNVQQPQTVPLNGNHLIQKSNFNPIHKFVLKMLDIVNPIIYKHPKLGAKLMRLSEKIVRRSDSLKI